MKCIHTPCHTKTGVFQWIKNDYHSMVKDTYLTCHKLWTFTFIYCYRTCRVCIFHIQSLIPRNFSHIYTVRQEKATAQTTIVLKFGIFFRVSCLWIYVPNIHKGGEKLFAHLPQNIYIVGTTNAHRFSHIHWFCLNLRLISKIFNWHTMFAFSSFSYMYTHEKWWRIFIYLKHAHKTHVCVSNHILFSWACVCVRVRIRVLSSAFNNNKYCSYNDDDLGVGLKIFGLENGMREG